MPNTYTHALRRDFWHVTGPEIDYRVPDDADGHHAELVASLLTLAYAAGRRDMVQEMAQDSQDKLDAMRRR